VSAGPYRLVVPEPTPAGRQAFGRAALPYLAKRETANNLQLSVLDHVMAGRYAGAILLATEDEHGDLAALLMRTPPFPLLVAEGCRPEARERLLAWFLEHDPDLPGMVGPLEATRAAVAWWREHGGRPMGLTMREGVYRLRSVRSRERAPGRMRSAGPGDREVALPWLRAFEEEAFGHVRGDPEETWASYHSGGVRRLCLWEDAGGTVVSLAARSGRTPTGVRIGPVYTPPPLRGRGFAEALIAALSQRELDDGARHCFLYTDLANRTSNALYERVGYERVGEAGEFRIADS